MGDGVACRKASPFCCLAEAAPEKRTRRMGAVYSAAANLVMVVLCLLIGGCCVRGSKANISLTLIMRRRPKRKRVLKFGVTRTSEINTPMSESKTYLEGVSTTLIQCN